ncbi:unnamed protein product [Choristocarpus tenellus]
MFGLQALLGSTMIYLAGWSANAFLVSAPMTSFTSSSVMDPWHRTMRNPAKHRLCGRGAESAARVTMYLEGGVIGEALWGAANHALASTALVLAEEMEAPPNIYGPIATGGVVIVLSGVVGAFIVSTIVSTMSDDMIDEVTDQLASGSQKASIEEEGRRTQERMKAVSSRPDPTFSAEDAAKVEAETEKAQNTIISTIDDEYDD